MSSSVYFAQDASDSKVVIAEFYAYQADIKPQKESLYWFALVDSAFDYPVSEDAPYLHGGLNCYSQEIHQSLENAAPWLVPIEKNAVALKRLIKHCSERPMLSFIASHEPMHQLKATWEEAHWVSDADNERMLLRFADTRTLPNIATILSPSQWAILTQSLEHWLYINREGHLQALPLAPKELLADDEIKFTQHQINDFLSSAEPDAVVDFIATDMRDVIPEGMKRSVFYALVVQTYKLAQKHHVQAFNDIVSLAVAACLTMGESNQNIKLLEALQSKKFEHGKIGELFIELGILQ